MTDPRETRRYSAEKPLHSQPAAYDGHRSVRLLIENVGLATTAYSYKLSYDELTEAAERISLLWNLHLGTSTEELRRTPQPAQIAVGSKAVEDVLAERQRQVEVEGWSRNHDDKHDGGQLAFAAAAYADDAGWQMHEARFGEAPKHADGVRDFGQHAPLSWPWEEEWWKPHTPRRELVKAGALILAEIERLDRAALASAEVEG